MSQTPPKVLTIFADFSIVTRPFQFTYYGFIYDLNTKQRLWKYYKNDPGESQSDDSVYEPMSKTARNGMDASNILSDNAMREVIEYKITSKNKIIIATNDNNFIEWFNDIKTHVTKNSIVPEETLEQHLKNEVDLFRFFDLMATAMLNLKRYITIETQTNSTILNIYPLSKVPHMEKSVNTMTTTFPTRSTPRPLLENHPQRHIPQRHIPQKLDRLEKVVDELLRRKRASVEESRHTPYSKTTPPTFNRYGDEIIYHGWLPGDDGPEG
jgi:hypothetical protein